MRLRCYPIQLVLTLALTAPWANFCHAQNADASGIWLLTAHCPISIIHTVATTPFGEITLDTPMDLSPLLTIAGPISQSADGTLSDPQATTSNIAGGTMTVQFAGKVSGTAIAVDRKTTRTTANTDQTVTAHYTGTVAGDSLNGTVEATYDEVQTDTVQGVSKMVSSGIASGTFDVQIHRSDTGHTNGSLRVRISPGDAIDAGAQWHRAGTATWCASGLIENDIVPGPYAVEFKPVAGWVTPSNAPVTIISGQTAEVSGRYIREACLTGSVRPSDTNMPILPGRECPVEITLTNRCTQPIDTQISLDIYLSKDLLLDPGSDVFVKSLPALAVKLQPGQTVSLTNTPVLPSAKDLGKDQAGVWYFLAEIKFPNGGSSAGSQETQAISSKAFWVGEVLHVITHGFGNGLLPNFLTPWYDLESKFVNLAEGHPVQPAIRSYVNVWESSTGWWPDAVLDDLSAVCCQLWPMWQQDALKRVDLDMKVARWHAEAAAMQAVEFAEKSWQLDPELTQNGYQVIHLIGHSRGGAVNARVAELLSRRGHRVNQYTALDGYSIDWPKLAGLLGDIDIVGELTLASARGVVDRKVNYRVEDGLAMVVFDLIEPYMEALSRRYNIEFLGFTDAFMTIIRNALADWRAPARAPYMQDLLITGTGTGDTKRSNHLNVPQLYVDSDARDGANQYVRDNYLGHVLAGTARAVALTSRQASPLGEVSTATNPDPANEPGSDFIDGTFESIGSLSEGIRSLDLPDVTDACIKLLLAELQDTHKLLASVWAATGDVSVVKGNGSWVAELRGTNSPTIGQFLVLLPGAERIEFDLSVPSADSNSVLEVLFQTNVAAILPLTNAPGSWHTFAPLSGASNSGQVQLRLRGSQDSTVVQLDNLRVVYAPPVITQADMTGDGFFRFVIQCAAGAVCGVEMSVDLQTWQHVGYAREASGIAIYAEQVQLNTSPQFYRVRVVR